AARDAGIERARFHVARHLLRAHQHAIDFRIVDGGKIAARTYRDAPAGAPQQLQRGILQAALGQAQFRRLHRASPPYTAWGSKARSSTTGVEPSSATRRKKQVR